MKACYVQLIDQLRDHRISPYTAINKCLKDLTAHSKYQLASHIRKTVLVPGSLIELLRRKIKGTRHCPSLIQYYREWISSAKENRNQPVMYKMRNYQVVSIGIQDAIHIVRNTSLILN